MSQRFPVLLVDDEPANLLALEAILEPLGEQLIRATSAKEALRHALKTDFALVLLDVQMPEMDGFACAELLRGRPRMRDVPVIFLTATSKDPRLVRRGYGVGAVDYLFKPFEPDVLRSKVAVFIGLARQRAVLREQHEQRYVDLADAMPQVVWTADVDGRVRFANRRFRELGEELGTIVHPGDLLRFLDGWHGALASGSPWESEMRLGNATAGYRVHLVSAMPRRDAAGRVVHWIGTSTDIHERVRAERAMELLVEASRRLAAAFEDPAQLEEVLRRLVPTLGDAAQLDLDAAGGGERRRMRVLADGVPEALLDDPRFALGPATVEYSQRAEVFLDVDADRERVVRGSDHVRFLAELGVGGYMCLPLASRGRSVGTLTLMLTRRGGSYAPSDQVLAEDLAGRIAVAVDNARLHETTEHRRALLEQANRSKDVFLATLSHELRTPLNAIVGWTAMMRSGQVDGSALLRAVETIDRNAHALSSLVADLLDVSRIVTGALKLDSALVSLASIAEAAVLAAQPQCADKGVSLEAAVERIGSVRGDAGRLRQVLDNLLSNALKFTPRGGTISIAVTREGQAGRIVVRDTGEGIASDLLPHVFERFRQAETARARGLGLGLAIVKHLVEEHGGTVTAESGGRGKGATLTMELPIVAEEAAAEPEESARSSESGARLPKLGGVRALVVEDDPDGSELITTILARYGADVTAVGTAAAALAAIEARVPDVLVSDIGLPDADGLDLIRTLRARPSCRDLPALALTAYASRQDAAKALSAGFDAHVAKPVQPATLGRAIARVLSRRRGRVKAQPAA